VPHFHIPPQPLSQNRYGHGSPSHPTRARPMELQQGPFITEKTKTGVDKKE
jgi:hypothetical protein